MEAQVKERMGGGDNECQRYVEAGVDEEDKELET
jgi:hypothetical protein